MILTLHKKQTKILLKEYQVKKIKYNWSTSALCLHLLLRVFIYTELLLLQRSPQIRTSFPDQKISLWICTWSQDLLFHISVSSHISVSISEAQDNRTLTYNFYKLLREEAVTITLTSCETSTSFLFFSSFRMIFPRFYSQTFNCFQTIPKSMKLSYDTFLSCSKQLWEFRAATHLKFS